ncbi:hypothetical protein HCN44_007212 [Aphidius gifuensis]|uniref:Uncharacterized protein n=1 Tax=Aphidius gifuensis TaxID=684658 RepID=A0A834XL68_APHGI|nr:hypothetical protein HCN44_007212 [Aphidius gifuensis]
MNTDNFSSEFEFEVEDVDKTLQNIENNVDCQNPANHQITNAYINNDADEMETTNYINQTNEDDMDENRHNGSLENNDDSFSQAEISIIQELRYENSDKTVAETVLQYLEVFVKDNLTKTALGKLLSILQGILPKPNRMPGTI